MYNTSLLSLCPSTRRKNTRFRRNEGSKKTVITVNLVNLAFSTPVKT